MEKCRSIFGTDEKSKLLQLICDAKLHTDDGFSFDVHRIILAKSNDYFLNLFCGVGGKDKKQYTIPGVPGECLWEIICYLYTGQTSLSSENMISIMVAADYLLVGDLVEEIKDSAESLICIDNCVPLLFHAHQISREDIFKTAFHFIETHFDLVVKKHKTQLAELPLELLQRCLCSKNLGVPDERLVWCTIVEWISKDVENRLSYAPLLLKHLAQKEIDENLAQEIVSHNIINTNPHFKIPHGHELNTSLDILHNILRVDSNNFDYIDYRNPSKLYVIAKICKVEDGENVDEEETGMEYVTEIYVTYDDNLHLWRKVAETDFHTDYIVTHRHNLYLFDSSRYQCAKLDLKENIWLDTIYMNSIDNFWFDSVVKHDRFLYVLGYFRKERVEVFEVFDFEGNEWRTASVSFGTSLCRAVYVSGYIYVVGYKRRQMFAQVYDPETQTLAVLPDPIKLYSRNSAFTAYHGKLFVIGGDETRTVEIFDLHANEWREGQNLPITYTNPKAVVLNDNLYVYEHVDDDSDEDLDPREARLRSVAKRTNLLWSEREELWEVLDESTPVKNIGSYFVCELNDAETIRFLSRGCQRRIETLQKGDFK